MILYLVVAESPHELGQMVGVSRNAILSHISHAKSGTIKQQRYFRIEIDDEEEG